MSDRQQMLWGQSPLTTAERRTLTDNAIGLCISRNAVMEIMSKCVLVRSYRELWVLDREHPRGQRII